MKKTTRIFFIILIVVLLAIIGVGAYFMIENKQNSDTRIGELENKIEDFAKNSTVNENNEIERNSITNTFNNTTFDTESSDNKIVNNTSSNITYNTLKGTYEGNIEAVEGSEYTTVYLTLYDNGSYAYYYDPNTDCHFEGYYIIKDNNLILYNLLDCANDPGATIVDEKITLKIDSDTQLTDSNKLKTTLRKSSSKYRGDTVVNLSTSLKGRLENNFLF